MGECLRLWRASCCSRRGIPRRGEQRSHGEYSRRNLGGCPISGCQESGAGHIGSCMTEQLWCAGGKQCVRDQRREARGQTTQAGSRHDS